MSILSKFINQDIFFFRSKDSVGWELIFSTPYLENCVEKMALNAKVSSSSLGDKMLAVSSGESFETSSNLVVLKNLNCFEAK